MTFRDERDQQRHGHLLLSRRIWSMDPERQGIIDSTRTSLTSSGHWTIWGITFRYDESSPDAVLTSSTRTATGRIQQVFAGVDVVGRAASIRPRRTGLAVAHA